MSAQIALQSPVTALDVDEYGHYLAVSTLSHGIAVFWAQTLAAQLQIATGDATAVSLDYSSRELKSLLAAGFTDGTVRVYQDGRELKQFEARHGSVVAVAFHPSRCSIAAASLDGTFSVHSRPAEGDWSSISVAASPMGLSAIAWGADADHIQTVVAGAVDGTVRIYKNAGAAWEMSTAVQVHNGWVRGIAVPRVPLGGCQKIGTVGDDSFAAVVKITGNEASVSEVKPLDSTACAVGRALVDKVLVLSHANGGTSFWKEDEDGQWVRTE
jgi:WD40 repeat protein